MTVGIVVPRAMVLAVPYYLLNNMARGYKCDKPILENSLILLFEFTNCTN